jgi:aspartate aminotransferase
LTTTKSNVRVAERIHGIGFSDIVQIRNKVMALRESGQQVHAFHGGEPFFATPEKIKYAAMRALVENQTHYAPSSGIEPLRVALAHKLSTRNQVPTSVDQVIVTAGGAHALYAAFQSVLNAGDEALVFSPYWTPIGDMIASAQARAVLVSTETALHEGMTATLTRFLTPATRAIYYNTPQNPAGTVFTRAQAEEVAAFAIQHDLVVIADEAYEDLVYDGEHVSIASLPGMAERTISTYTFSKSYAMTGWRVGYAVAQEPFMSALRKMVLYSTNGVSTPIQWAALEALKTPRVELDARREQYRERRDLLVNGLNELGFSCAMPSGAFYAFARVPKLRTELDATDSRAAAVFLLDQAHVATIPGSVFGTHGEGHLRFGYAVSVPAIEAGLDALRKLIG